MTYSHRSEGDSHTTIGEQKCRKHPGALVKTAQLVRYGENGRADDGRLHLSNEEGETLSTLAITISNPPYPVFEKHLRESNQTKLPPSYEYSFWYLLLHTCGFHLLCDRCLVAGAFHGSARQIPQYDVLALRPRGRHCKWENNRSGADDRSCRL